MIEDDKIYQFLSEDIALYMEKFEVLATEEFKEKQIRQPKLGSLGVRIENNLLDIELSQFNFDKKELKEIIARYNLKKKYYRLKDGTFLTLEQNEDIDFLNRLLEGSDMKYEDLEQDSIMLPMYRSLYLERILENTTVRVKKDQTYKEMVNEIEEKQDVQDTKLPESLQPILREYQKIGFQWLKALDKYDFGGILADDMGLRKNPTNNCYYIGLSGRRQRRT